MPFVSEGSQDAPYIGEREQKARNECEQSPQYGIKVALAALQVADDEVPLAAACFGQIQQLQQSFADEA